MQITLDNLHAPCTWSLHVTSPCDSCTWLLCSSTQFVELSQLNTSSRFWWKHNFFGAPKICSVSTWRITWLFLFTLSISLNQPSVLQGWLFYNSKSSKPNGSASPLEKRKRRLVVGLLETLSELPSPLLQWPNLVLAKTLVKTPHLSCASSMSLLNKLQKLWLIIVALAFPLSISLVLTGLRPHFNFSSHQRTIQIAPKDLLGSPISAQAEPRERLSKLNGTAKTSDSYHTPFAAFLLCETIMQQWV